MVRSKNTLKKGNVMKLKMLTIMALMCVAHVKPMNKNIPTTNDYLLGKFTISRNLQGLEEMILMEEKHISKLIKNFSIDDPSLQNMVEALNDHKDRIGEYLKEYANKEGAIGFWYWDKLHSLERQIEAQIALANSEGDARTRWEQWLKNHPNN